MTFIYLFIRRSGVYLKPETVTVIRQMDMMWMINYVHIRGDECGLNFLIFVLHLRKTPEKAQPRIEAGHTG